MRDLRKYASQTQFRLLLGGLVLLFVVGDGLIYLIFGRNAAVTGLICLAAGITPILVIILILAVLDWVVRHSNRE